MTKEKEVKLKAGKYMKYNQIIHLNKKARTPWAGLVTEYKPDAKYSIQLDWLGKEHIDGDVHYNLSGLAESQIIKINGGSWKNHYPQYYKVKGWVDEETIKLKPMKEAEVIDELEEDGEVRKLRRIIWDSIQNIDDEDNLREIIKNIQDLTLEGVK